MTTKQYTPTIDINKDILKHTDLTFGGVYGYIHKIYYNEFKKRCKKAKLHHIPNYSKIFDRLNFFLHFTAYGHYQEQIMFRDDEGIDMVDNLLGKSMMDDLFKQYVDFTKK